MRRSFEVTACEQLAVANARVLEKRAARKAAAPLALPCLWCAHRPRRARTLPPGMRRYASQREDQVMSEVSQYTS